MRPIFPCSMIAYAFAPRAFAIFTAASVSAVSPDCEMARQSTRSPTSGSPFRNSLASSTWTGTRASASIMSRPERPACHEVPQATITIRSSDLA